MSGREVAPTPPAPSTHTTPASVEPPVKQTERPHPLTPFVKGWIVFVAIVFGFGRQLVDSASDRDGLASIGLTWIVLGVLAVCLLAAVSGFVSWRFTRFVIDDTEVRVETGVLFKTSRKVAFERIQSVDLIQPLAARIFSLAELRIEAGAGDSGIRLRYLSRAKASRLRDYLLSRAHGTRTRLSDTPGGPARGVLFDSGVADTVLVTVSPAAIVGSFLLSTEFLVPLVILGIAAIVVSSTGLGLVVLGGLLPVIFGLVSLVSRRVLAMFHFTLAESTRGLRITRGLTNLTSQSVPIDRIQGVKLCQPVLWRPAGWWRVDVDIVGYGSSGGEDNSGSATNVLLPVASRAQVDLALGRVLPGLAVTSIEMQRAPTRSRWLSWFDWWTLRYGWDDRALVTEHGWLVHERHVVPHAKTQSVRIEQGPLQRRLGLADVHVDTPKGPVHAVAHQMDVVAARQLALGQLDRARTARAAEAEEVSVPTLLATDDPEDRAVADAVLAELGTSRDRLLGAGGESEVFALDETRVVRLYRPAHESAHSPVVDQLRSLCSFWDGADRPSGGLQLPLILGAGVSHGRSWTVDRRFAGGPLDAWLPTADVTERRAALTSLLDAAVAISRLPMPVDGFARLVGEGAPQTYASLTALLDAMLAGPVGRSRTDLERDVPDVAGAWDRLHRDLAARRVAPALVHGDLGAPNAYISPDFSSIDGPPRVTGVGDFSPHTLQADPLMDLTGAVAFLELGGYPEAAADSEWLLGVAVQRYGPEVAHWIGVYRRYFGFYFSDTARSDPATYGWCLRQLDRG